MILKNCYSYKNEKEINKYREIQSQSNSSITKRKSIAEERRTAIESHRIEVKRRRVKTEGKGNEQSKLSDQYWRGKTEMFSWYQYVFEGVSF